jgi:alpha-galactosidase
MDHASTVAPRLRDVGLEEGVMNRRSFVTTSGLSLAALLIERPLRSGLPGRPDPGTIHSPDEVVVICEKNAFVLTSSDGKTWSRADLWVKLSEVGNAVAVDLQSPEQNPKFIVLKWKAPRETTVRCLGDQWERSYGDLHWRAIGEERIMPWYFMELDGKVTNGFGVKTGCRSLCFWQMNTEDLTLTLDIRSGGNGVRLGDRILRAAEIVVQQGNEEDSPFVSTQKFCRLMCDSPRLPKQPVYGINDWYFTYGNSSEDLIIQHASLMADLTAENSNKPFCVVDAGWAVESPNVSRNCWGDSFDAPNSHFSDMAVLAEKIRRFGMRPGIWVRPLCGSIKDDVSRLMPKIPRMDSPKAPFLDPTISENIERIKNYFVLYRKWGYELIKHDFTTADLLGKWGFKMIESKDVTFDNWRFSDDTISNAEIVLNLYRAIREASGDTCIIGCNTLSHLSAGLFELQRIGDDTSGQEWDRTKRMGVNTLGFRIAQHKSFYATDGDCVGLTTKVPWEKNRQWMQLLAESGTPLFVSAQKEAVGDPQRTFIKQCFSTASQPMPTGEPLDWMENQCPSAWRLRGRVVQFDWN